MQDCRNSKLSRKMLAGVDSKHSSMAFSPSSLSFQSFYWHLSCTMALFRSNLSNASVKSTSFLSVAWPSPRFAVSISEPAASI